MTRRHEWDIISYEGKYITYRCVRCKKVERVSKEAIEKFIHEDGPMYGPREWGCID